MTREEMVELVERLVHISAGLDRPENAARSIIATIRPVILEEAAAKITPPSTTTREGKVMQRMADRIRAMAREGK